MVHGSFVPNGGILMNHRLIAVFTCPILVLACRFAISAPIKTEPPKPIPAGPDCYTQAKFDVALAKVHYRTIVEAYRKVGVHDPKWDDKAVSFLEGYAKGVGKPNDASFAAKLLADGEALVALGCTDPQVQYAYASACGIKKDLEKAETYFRKSMEGFEKSKYPKIRVRQLLSACTRSSGHAGPPLRRRRSASPALPGSGI